MSTVYHLNGKRQMLTKGGPDVVFNRCTHILIDGEERPLDKDHLQELQNQNKAFSNNALACWRMDIKTSRRTKILWLWKMNKILYLLV
jgi:magnesium-transporting ATPase (P-type)